MSTRNPRGKLREQNTIPLRCNLFVTSRPLFY